MGFLVGSFLSSAASFWLCPQIRISWTPLAGFVEFPGDVDHHLGAVASEEDDAGRAIGFQAELLSFRDAIDRRLFVELWFQDHSRCLEDMVGGVADGQGLLPGAFRPGDDVFRLALNPEMRRVIRQIGY